MELQGWAAALITILLCARGMGPRLPAAEGARVVAPGRSAALLPPTLCRPAAWPSGRTFSTLTACCACCVKWVLLAMMLVRRRLGALGVLLKQFSTCCT